MIEIQTQGKNGIANPPIPDYDFPGVTDLPPLHFDDLIQIEGQTLTLTVGFVSVRGQEIISGTTKHVLEASHGRADARSYDLFEQINLVDGSVIQIIGIDRRLTRVFEVAQ
jgi:hypothetical protein